MCLMKELLTGRMKNQAITAETQVFEVIKCVLMIVGFPQDHNIMRYLFWKVWELLKSPFQVGLMYEQRQENVSRRQEQS